MGYSLKFKGEQIDKYLEKAKDAYTNEEIEALIRQAISPAEFNEDFNNDFTI